MMFNSHSTKRIALLACEQVGLRVPDLQLIRLGENALFRVPAEGVVVRIARTMSYWPDVVREVGVSQWLRECGVPAARVVDEIEQPIEVDGHPVTFWHHIPGEPAPYSRIGDLGALLRQVHRLTPPAHLDLPAEDVLDRVRPRIEAAPIDEDDRAFLLKRVDELHDPVDALDYVQPCSVVHGDAHIGNLMICGGDPVLIDFERVAVGQPEWDLGMTATEHRTAGWWSPEQYRQFVDAYGFDVTEWDGFPVVQAVHELKMTTWLMQNVHSSQEVAAEFASRMRTIRDRQPSTWRPW